MIDESGLIQHARELAHDLGGGPVAGALLAMAEQHSRLVAERDEWRTFGGEALVTTEDMWAQRDAARAWARRWKEGMRHVRLRRGQEAAERDAAVASVAALLDAYIGITPGATVAGLAPQVQADAERLLERLDAMETALRTARDFAWYWPAGGPRDTVLAAIDAALEVRE